MEDLSRMVVVAMTNDYVDLCFSDGLSCSCDVKGVGIGLRALTTLTTSSLR